MKVKKKKWIALLLAIFLPIFTWVYTYKKDNWKFWVGMATLVIAFISEMGGVVGVIVMFVAITDVLAKQKEWYENY